MTEDEFIALLRPLAGEGARDLRDDAAVIGELVLTHDVIVEGVHYRSEDAPADVAWKLVAVNVSDLAAKGAAPVGVLLGYPLGDGAWDRAFAAGLAEVLAAFDCPLLGGDTVKATGPRSLSLTAIGRATVAPSRAGARVGDALWVTGTIGLAGLGLDLLSGRPAQNTPLPRDDATASPGTNGREEAVGAYLRPQPRLAEGRVLAPLVTAMMDVSDGLLIDAARLADASGVAIAVDLALVPLPHLRPAQGERDLDAMLTAVTAGDDYELLFTLPPGASCPVAATRIGSVREGKGLTLAADGVPVPLPARLGYRHG